MFGKDKKKKAQQEALRASQIQAEIQAEESKKKFSEEKAILEKKIREDVTNY